MELLYALEKLRTPFLDGVFSAVTYLGDETVFLVVVLICIWCVDKRFGYRLFCMGMVGNTLNQLLKAVFVVPRPWVRDPAFTIVESAREGATGYSFPSGHTQSVFTVFGGTATRIRRTWAYIAAAALILVTAFSRMYLGVHTPLDVGVSLGTGLLTVAGFTLLFSRLGDSKRGMLAVWLFAIAFAAALLAYNYLAPARSGSVAEYDGHGVSTAWTILGTTVGVFAAWLIDERYIRYEVKAVWWAQLLKCSLGFVVIVGLRMLLKAPLLALTGGHPCAGAIRYFIMVLFGGAVWPLTFKWFSRLKAVE